MLTATLLTNTPVPVWFVRLPAENAEQILRDSATDLLLKMDRELCGCSFRGVSMDRLRYVLGTGIDVSPTDAPIYVDHISKAIEYGGWPKVLLALDVRQLDQTYREVDASLPEVEIALLQQRFPTMLKSTDGSKLWLSRLEEGDTRIGSPYEWQYARWIPGDPIKALKAIVVCASESDVPLIEGVLASAK